MLTLGLGRCTIGEKGQAVLEEEHSELSVLWCTHYFSLSTITFPQRKETRVKDVLLIKVFI